MKLGVVLALSVVWAGTRALADGEPVYVQPGDDIQALVSTKGPGAKFVFRPGVYRNVSIQPQDGQQFIGEPGAVLSGAALLSEFEARGQFWLAPRQQTFGLSRPGAPCLASHPRCGYPEDLFVNDRPLLHVSQLSDLGPGRWYFEYGFGLVYLGDDPTGARVELSLTPYAFQGPARGVTVRGLTIEKYATPPQAGTIGAESGVAEWVIAGNEIRWNHGIGVRIGDRSAIQSNRVHSNGQLGIGGTGADVLVEGNEIYFNNVAGFQAAWEGGATKFVKTTGLRALRNYVHDNAGAGLWTDIDNIQTLYEQNTVLGNQGGGIVHEISYDAVIRDNVVRGNGYSSSAWLWGAQIQIQNSRNVEVFGNKVVVAATGGNGIVLVQQERGSGSAGPYLTLNNYVHHNSVRYLGNAGVSGAAADFQPEPLFSGNRGFDHNHYCLPRGWSKPYWAWNGDFRQWADFQKAGQEPNGIQQTEPCGPVPLGVGSGRGVAR